MKFPTACCTCIPADHCLWMRDALFNQPNCHRSAALLRGVRPVRPPQEVFGLTYALLERNPYALEAMPVHLTAALELRKKNELFLRGHRHAACGILSHQP